MTTFFKKLTTGLLTLVLSVSPFFSALTLVPNTAHAATFNTLIKGSGQTLYWYASNGRRYVFPNIRTFYSWYSVNDFNRVQVLGDTELYTIPLGGNVTYRPGARLVKITTDPRVYAVSRYGVLRWVSSESIARTLYGNSWAQWVDDVPDEFFTNYTIGSPIYNNGDYNVSTEFNAVSNPSDNIGTPNNAQNPINTPNANGLSATVSLDANATTFPSINNDRLVVTAAVSNSSVATDNLLLNIYREGNTAPVQTCWSVSRCVFSSAIPQGPTTLRYYVDVMERGTNRLITRTYSSYITINGVNNNQGTGTAAYLNTTVSRSTLGISDSLTLTASIDRSRSTLPSSWTLDILDPRTNTSLQTCRNTDQCTTALVPGIRLGVTNIIFHALLKDSSGVLLRDEWFPTVTVINNTNVAAPTISYPAQNQVLTTYPRSLTVQWQGANSPKYRVQLDCNLCGTTPAWSGQPRYFSVENYQGTLVLGGESLPGDNQYRVRVQAVALDGSQGNWSEYTYFSFQTNNASVPATPVITSPTNNQLFTNYPRVLDIAWSGSWAKKHTIEIACDICVSRTNLYQGNPEVYTTDNYDTHKTITAGADNTYRIRVKGVNENGGESAWSDYVYFSFRTPYTPPASTENNVNSSLQITDVLFRNATVNDNVGTAVGLRLNRQPYSVSLTFKNIMTGQVIQNGYSNITRSNTTPYEDGYVMLMDHLTPNTDYEYNVVATDWNNMGNVIRTGVYHAPAQSNTFVYLDFQVVGSSQQGTMVVSPTQCDASLCGYNFVAQAASGYTGGAFYTIVQDNQILLLGNNVGQGGAVILNGPDSNPPLTSSGQYNRFSTPLTTDGWYAVYDEANHLIIKLHVARIVRP